MVTRLATLENLSEAALMAITGAPLRDALLERIVESSAHIPLLIEYCRYSTPRTDSLADKLIAKICSGDQIYGQVRCSSFTTISNSTMRVRSGPCEADACLWRGRPRSPCFSRVELARFLAITGLC